MHLIPVTFQCHQLMKDWTAWISEHFIDLRPPSHSLKPLMRPGVGTDVRLTSDLGSSLMWTYQLSYEIPFVRTYNKGLLLLRTQGHPSRSIFKASYIEANDSVSKKDEMWYRDIFTCRFRRPWILLEGQHTLTSSGLQRQESGGESVCLQGSVGKILLHGLGASPLDKSK